MCLSGVLAEMAGQHAVFPAPVPVICEATLIQAPDLLAALDGIAPCDLCGAPVVESYGIERCKRSNANHVEDYHNVLYLYIYVTRNVQIENTILLD